jgi:hypothetical protein
VSLVTWQQISFRHKGTHYLLENPEINSRHASHLLRRQSSPEIPSRSTTSSHHPSKQKMRSQSLARSGRPDHEPNLTPAPVHQSALRWVGGFIFQRHAQKASGQSDDSLERPLEKDRIDSPDLMSATYGCSLVHHFTTPAAAGKPEPGCLATPPPFAEPSRGVSTQKHLACILGSFLGERKQPCHLVH